jgi:hypothetical protein
MTALAVPSGSSTTTTIVKRENPYAIGSSILALKLTRLEMLTSSIGVGVAPIVTYSGRLVRAYLVRTNNAGASWTVTGDLPEGFYPWTTAFASPSEGYVINSGGALFTKDAGRTWSKVVTSYSPLSISLVGNVVWIAVENYCSPGETTNTCRTYLDSYDFGSLVPTTVSKVPSNQPLISHTSSSSGYAISSTDFEANVYATANAGSAWRVVPTPCAHHQVSGSSVVSSTKLFIYCELGPATNPGPTLLYKSDDAGVTWQMIHDVSVLGLDGAVGTTGQYLWQFGQDAVLSESSDGGLQWSSVANVKYGTNGTISTYGAHRAWHVLTGQGIYRTLNGRTWKLLK